MGRQGSSLPPSSRRGTCFLVAAWLVIALAASAQGQRVQIPAGSLGPINASPPPATFATPAPAFGPPSLPPPAFDPYATGPSIGAPPAGAYPPSFSGAPSYPGSVVYPGAPGGGFSAPAIPQSAYGAAPAYPSGPPPAWPGSAPSGWTGAPQPASPSDASWFPDTGVGWEQGTYGFQQPDGSTVRFQQFFQRLRAEHTYLLGDGTGDAFDVNRTELSSTFAVPLGGRIETPLLLTPGFAFNWFEGPIGDPMMGEPDLPPRAYDAYLDASWYPQLTQRVSAELGLRTGVWTDFSNVNTDSLRVLGRGLASVAVSPNFEVLAGVVFLDRVRIKMLPAGGFHWRPDPDTDVYAVFPNPRFRRRMNTFEGVEWWWFVAGEYGGGSWTVDRGGVDDRIDYNDLRVSLGLEFETQLQRRGRMEIGYAFDREVIFESRMPPVFEPDDTVMFRVGFDY